MAKGTSVSSDNAAARIRPGFDAGLRAYMLRIYGYMTGGLVLTGVMAYLGSHYEPLLQALYVVRDGHIVGATPLSWIVMFAPLGLVMLLSFGLRSMSFLAAQLTFWAYAALVGLSLSSIFLVYTSQSISTVFFIAAATFGAMSLFGYVTRADLTKLGSILFMALLGLIIASLVNMFLHSSAFQLILSVVGVLIFVGLTAYDTQKLKLMYADAANGPDWLGKIVILGALTLYLDFLNIFVQLLYIFGDRRR